MAVIGYVAEDVVPERVLAALTQAGFEVGSSASTRRTLLDTFDGRLHAAGLRLEARHAAQPRGTRVDLILSDSGPAAAHVAIDAVPSTPADLPSGPIRSRLAPLLDLRALMAIVQVDGRQLTAVRRDGKGKALVTVELYSQLSHHDVALPMVAEVTSLKGYPGAARQAENVLESLGLLRSRGDALDLAASRAGIDVRGFAGSPTVPLDPSEHAVAGFRRVLTNLADTIDANWQGTVDDLDSEFLHDLRVAVRRTRSVLSNAKGVLPRDGRNHFRSEFGWLGDITTPSRDLDVYVIEWPSYVAPLGAAAADLAPVIDHIARRRSAEHVTLAETLRSGRYRAVTHGWRAWIGALDGVEGEAKEARRPLGPVVGRRLTEAQSQLLSRGRCIEPTSPAESLHELRKDAKKLRYLLECFGGVLPAAPRKNFVQRLKALQDNLGEHQDTEVHTAQLRALSEELHAAPGISAETLLAMGRLAELFDQRRKAAREVFAQRFSAYDTDQTARAFSRLILAASKS